MCTGKCAKCIGASLYPLAFCCVIANILLFFPNFEVEYVEDTNKLTPEVLYLGGILGGGIMILFPAIHIHATGNGGCCTNRCGMFLSIIFAALGVVGSGYCLATSSLGLVNGPMCVDGTGNWTRPFLTDFEDLEGNFSISEENYLFHYELWDKCHRPKDVILFNVVLFALLIGCSLIELVLCLLQMINGLFGCICGTCGKRRANPV
ncbi:transmembrane 4 L6 family member 5 isoform X1 [Carcharodon carcharias]|uniref:transmembrane 4 L6 family member 5 isoform X1 n=1 Tax=Carcharodon carcharias TaxID=13397 RepID=UPI001B7F444D|nr:transmembrane 4 L6 family member 5 isoform X1 [Carcharodon carcharias]